MKGGRIRIAPLGGGVAAGARAAGSRAAGSAVPVSTGAAREIAFADTTKVRAPVQWSADGRSLYAVEPAFGAPLRIFRIDVATGAETLWKELQPPEPTGVAVIPEVVIAPDGKSYAYSFTQMLGDLYLATGLN
jgi:hypothetical protein